MKTRLMDRLYQLWGELPIPKWLRGVILRTGNQRFLVGVAAVVLDEHNRVLFFKHTYRPDMPWGLPGGWLKKGEDPIKAVEREIMEESGFRVQVYQPLRVRQLEIPSSIDIVFSARYIDGNFQPSSEVIQAEFFPYPDFPPVYPSIWVVVEQALEAANSQPEGIIK